MSRWRWVRFSTAWIVKTTDKQRDGDNEDVVRCCKINLWTKWWWGWRCCKICLQDDYEDFGDRSVDDNKVVV